ncbi:NAD(P)/FAD-dependent oxidoreductase [Novosphingobium sp. M1R2S20]|uniref:NAD(P)/FAD-dependent oxidoreductase n=1 Tax=Novosphingobium rhizovicinum TaxID=3228928 RepID=A0ABV3R8T5_9SPHN
MSEAVFDIVIVGAGMAGASLGAELAQHADVLVLEAEERPGYHTTGRSAAFWTESYGGPGVHPLTSASGPALQALGFLSPRQALTIGTSDQAREIAAFARAYSALGIELHLVGRAELEERIGGLRSAWTHGVLEPSCCDIDVAGLHQHYLALLRAGRAQLWSRAALIRAERTGGEWLLELADGREVRCAVLVNAAGAWADPVAQLAGASPKGIAPLRRTIAQLRVTPNLRADLPLVLDVAGQFYFKPETGRLWLSPHDETPSIPCDAAPEEIDVAVAISRLEQVVDWRVDQVEHRWAGLRSFAPDRLPVYGFDAQVPGFFWFAGQGGFGIQTAPAAATLGASLLLGHANGGIDAGPYLPSRF